MEFLHTLCLALTILIGILFLTACSKGWTPDARMFSSWFVVAGLFTVLTGILHYF